MKRTFPLGAQIKPSTHFKYAFLNRSHKTKISRSISPVRQKISKKFSRCSYRASISADFYHKLFPPMEPSRIDIVCIGIAGSEVIISIPL